MSLNLEKGGRINLSKDGDSVQQFYVGLGWDEPSISGGTEWDLDVSAFILDENGTCDQNNVVYYGKLKSPNGEVVHTGDNLTGAGDGDDEAIIVDLSKVSPNTSEIAIMVTIHQAEQRRQNFGGVRNSFIRVCTGSNENGEELVKFDLEEDYSAFTAIHFGSIYRKDNDWKFKAVGDGFKNDLNGILAEYSTPVTAG